MIAHHWPWFTTISLHKWSTPTVSLGTKVLLLISSFCASCLRGYPAQKKALRRYQEYFLPLVSLCNGSQALPRPMCSFLLVRIRYACRHAPTTKSPLTLCVVGAYLYRVALAVVCHGTLQPVRVGVTVEWCALLGDLYRPHASLGL